MSYNSSMIIFDGEKHAKQKFAGIKTKVQTLKEQGKIIKIASILFHEDAGSQLYAGIKQAQAKEVGIEYILYTFSLTDSLEKILRTIYVLNNDVAVTGIIIQKPWRKTWETVRNHDLGVENYDSWWHELYRAVDPAKDVDGLHRNTIQAIKDGSWEAQGKVLPATCRAVLYIFNEAIGHRPSIKAVIIGKSDLLGIPLYYVLKQRGFSVELLGKKELDKRVDNGQALRDADVVISATGVNKLITGELIAEDSVLIDVGEPKPDVDQASVTQKAAFLTPVPGGVGPLTVACLLENAVELTSH